MESLLSFQVGVGFLAQYFIKPMLGFFIVMVCLIASRLILSKKGYVCWVAPLNCSSVVNLQATDMVMFLKLWIHDFLNQIMFNYFYNVCRCSNCLLLWQLDLFLFRAVLEVRHQMLLRIYLRATLHFQFS